MPKKKSTAVVMPRFWVLVFLISTLFCLVFYQLIQLHVLRRESLQSKANSQHLLRVDIPPHRGQIVDRTGKEFATNLRIPSVYAVPRMMSEAEKIRLIEPLSKILEVTPGFLRDRFDRDKAFIWLKRRVTPEQGKAVKELKSSALGMIEEYKRFYPQGDLLSHVLGFTNIDNIGIEGIELYANRHLSGQSGKRYTKRDALGREVRAFEIKTIPSVDGNKITLTFDQYIQYLTERALDEAYTKWNAKAGWAVVMEVATGRVLAMANRPHYNPNEVPLSSREDRRNRAVTDMYEPGSIFKIVAASAVLNENKATPETTFFCENGSYRYGSKTLRDVKPYGDLSFSEVLVKSSNIGTVKMAALLKPEVFQKYIEAFGFGKKTEIDLPGEATGFTNPPKRWSKTSPYNIPMGHEIMVTALQMVTAMSVVANGGELVQPYVIEKIEDQHGVALYEAVPKLKRRVIRPEVAAVMRNILTRVVEEGTGKRARIKDIPVAGKTGTAQKVLEGGGGYSHTDFMSSFVGFAPADAPMLAMVVTLDDPGPKYYGGTVAAPVFQEVMEPALLSLGYVPNNAESLVITPQTNEGVQESQPTLLPNPAPGRAA